MKKKSILMLSLILSVFVMTANSAITVRMKNTAQWSPVGLYAWEGGDALPSELNSWPGIELTADADGLYSYTFPEGVTSVNIIFNNMQNKDNANTDKFQTNDIKGVTESTCYEVLGNKNHKVIVQFFLEW